jgi:hypothetical protein
VGFFVRRCRSYCARAMLVDVSTVNDLREVALALPETSEKSAWGMPTFRVRDKIFAALNASQGVGIKIDREDRAELAAAEPAKFFWTDHDERFDLMRLHLDAIDRDELEELVTEAWRRTAPKALVKEFDADQS